MDLANGQLKKKTDTQNNNKAKQTERKQTNIDNAKGIKQKYKQNNTQQQ